MSAAQGWNPMAQVAEFHKKYQQAIREKPSLSDEKIRALRIRLLQEEFLEYKDAENFDQLIKIADALADMVYVICGTALEYGIPLQAVFEEVHRSNMTKEFRGHGEKVGKGADYEKPKIKEIIHVAQFRIDPASGLDKS